MKFVELPTYHGLSLLSPNRVRKEAMQGTLKGFKCISAIIQHFIIKPSPTVVPVFNFTVLEMRQDSHDSQYGTYRYSYDMARMYPLNADEKYIIESFRAYRHLTSLPKEAYIAYPKLIPLRASYPLMFKFMSKVIREQRYTDIHDGNFMKDRERNYRIIDLEGFINYKGLDDPSNKWITR